MEDEKLIQTAYIEMYKGMIDKERIILEKVLDVNFVLIHMTGMQQSREAFVKSILNGTLNYYSARHEKIQAAISGNTASIIGQSVVEAAVFGGRRSAWQLELQIEAKKYYGNWIFTKARALTWWGDWPMILYTFFENEDLSGKKLIPFATHEGSGLSGFDKKLAAAVPDSEALTGLAIRGNNCQNRQDNVRSTVSDWLSKLEY